LENIRLEDSLMKTNCRNLGLCYARQERYEEAMSHFEQMIERLTIDDPQSTDARLEFIHEINDWMNEVEQMQYAALHTDPEEVATSAGTPTEDSSDEGRRPFASGFAPNDRRESIISCFTPICTAYIKGVVASYGPIPLISTPFWHTVLIRPQSDLRIATNKRALWNNVHGGRLEVRARKRAPICSVLTAKLAAVTSISQYHLAFGSEEYC
jgi:hypothetical protein